MSLVLVVDDDPATREVIAAAIREDGREVISTAVAEEALELLERLPVGLVFLDLGLPGMRGEEFLQERRARGLESKAAVVVITAAGDASTASRVRSLGASLTVAKPFNTEELITIARKFVGETTPSTARPARD